MGAKPGLSCPLPLKCQREILDPNRRSTAAHGIVAYPRWSVDMDNWHATGGNGQGVKVELSESVVDSGTGYEIVEVTVTVVLGSTDIMFLRLELVPTSKERGDRRPDLPGWVNCGAQGRPATSREDGKTCMMPDLIRRAPPGKTPSRIAAWCRPPALRAQVLALLGGV